MRPVKEFLSLFGFADGGMGKVHEDFDRLESRGTTGEVVCPPQVALERAAQQLQNWGTFRFGITCGEGESRDFYSEQGNFNQFLDELQADISYGGFDASSFHFVFIKPARREATPVFHLESFVAYLAALKCTEQLKLLWSRFEPRNLLVFELVEDRLSEFGTSTIFFLKGRSALTEAEVASAERARKNRHDSKSRFDAIRSVCHFESASICRFIPEDFRLGNRAECPAYLLTFLDRLGSLHNIISLFDITRLTDTGLEYKLNGYKAVTGEIAAGQLTEDTNQQYALVYDWVYEGGNLSDKIGLARNLLSIHLVSPQQLELVGSPFEAIRSAFELYLKQNIKQYIEIRGKVSDQLIDHSNKAGKIAEEFAGSYKKSIMAFVSFFASVIIAKVLTSKNFTHIFTRESTILSFFFLLIAAVYFGASYLEFGSERKRFKESYDNLKNRFKDLLTEGDIDRIMDNDRTHRSDLAYMKTKVRRFSIVWAITLLALLNVVLLLSDTYNYTSVGQWFSRPPQPVQAKQVVPTKKEAPSPVH